MTALVGRKLDRYEIGDLLGAGGMGSVYRARDTHLKRDVAIKVLAGDSQDDPGRVKRFDREIRTVAKLSHPNILKVHDFGQADGISYAVMELLKGRDLRALMRKGVLPVERALQIGISVAEGLGAAHHQRVLHRDIKPENIFITSDGKVKILDFGLARDVPGSEPDAETLTIESSLTTPGTIVGTTEYMSPEQVRGQELDPRSDIFSLGCVLYEMFSGTHPFRRQTRPDTISAILNHEPSPISDSRPDLPPAVDVVVRRCLNKNPDERFDSARDVAFALGAMSESQSGQQPVMTDTVPLLRKLFGVLVALVALAAVAVAAAYVMKVLKPPPMPDQKRISVMTFRTSGQDEPDARAFAAGLTEVVASGLEFLEQSSEELDWVVPRPAAGDRDPARLPELHQLFAITLGVTAGLERDGDHIRLALEAVDPITGRTLRTAKLADDASNVATFQSQLVLTAAEMLGLDVNDAGRDRLLRGSTNVTAAFERLVRGTGLAVAGTDEPAILAAVDDLTEAVRLDPTLTAARVELARACLKAHELTGDPVWLDRAEGAAAEAAHDAQAPAAAFLTLAALADARGDRDRSIAALRQAVEAEPRSGEAHLKLARELRVVGRASEAEREYHTSIYLRPGYWPAHYWLARLYESQGLYNAAITEYRRVVELAPAYPGAYTNLGVAYVSTGQLDLARSTLEQSVALEQTRNYPAFANLGSVYFEEARFADAAEMFERALAIEDGDYRLWGNLGFAYQSGAEPERAERPFRAAIAHAESELEHSANKAEVLSQIAMYHAALGQQKEGLAALNRAVASSPEGADVIADIAEAFEDLGQREAALEWVERAFSLGVPPSRFENVPSMRGLIADDRYGAALEQRAKLP
jgi:tetratricopeptide (TPR) repeat protein